MSYTNIRIVSFVLIVMMCFTTFFTQKQIMSRSGPVEGQAATIQRFMLYGMPATLFVSGFFFPIGVLLYWFTNNLWTLGQQYFILRKLPPPGSDAAKAKAAADKPYVDPKTLAPKPGAKPVRGKPARPAGPTATSPDPAGGDGTAQGSTAAGSTGNGDARPATGQGGPARPGGQGPANRGKRKRR